MMEVGDKVAEAFSRDRASAKVQRKGVNAEAVHTFLFNAWGAELLLVLQEKLAGSEEE